MMSAVRTNAKRYGGGALAVISAAMTAVAATFNTVTVLAVGTAIVAVLLAAMSGYFVGSLRRTHELIESIGQWPASINVATTDDGSAVAFVQRQSGELTTVAIPDDVAHDREAVVAYVLRAIGC